MRGIDMDQPQAQDISERDREVLRFIGGEALLGFTFEGLKRSLGTHSETLSRILDRLEEQRVVEKTLRGYQVTERGKELMGLRQLSNSTPKVTLLRTLLPRVENQHETISGLKGRWFGPLRWLGYSEDQDGITMKWVTEDGGVQVDAVFAEEELVIEGRIREGKDLTDAIRASHQLVGYISRVYPTRNNGRVALYSPQAFFIPN